MSSRTFTVRIYIEITRVGYDLRCQTFRITNRCMHLLDCGGTLPGCYWNTVMDDFKSHYDDEIDLVELFQTVWDGKWKIISFVVVSVVSVFGYQISQPAPSFTATTEIRPISTIQAERYTASNAVGFFQVRRSQLLDLYIEQLEERSLFEEAIRTFQLLDADKYDDEQAFNDAVVALASSIEVLAPHNADGAERGDVRRFGSIVFEHNDAEKWKSVLSSVNSIANNEVRLTLQRRFATSLSVARQNREFELEDIKTQMANVKRDFDKEMDEFELKHSFQLEDVETQIANALADYERKTADRLAFLREQAAIARKLGVAKNTIEAQTFSVQNGMVANVKTDTPFYLRGYEAIEKEVELIESRENTQAFIDGLLELEQKKRRLEQDRTLQRAEKNKVFLDALIELEKKKREIEQDKTLKRAEALFASTPIMSSSDFSAVSVNVEATDFRRQSQQKLALVMAVLIGGMMGMVYVLISTAIRNRKQRLEESRGQPT